MKQEKEGHGPTTTTSESHIYGAVALVKIEQLD
jgi:hypothetical protein